MSKTPFFFLLSFAFLFAIASISHAADWSFSLSVDDYQNGGPIVVPPGNQGNSRQEPNIARYHKVLNLLQEKGMCVVKEAAKLYDLDPVLILGSIAGEHTFNVDSWDYFQGGYIYMVKKWVTRFYGNGLDLIELINEQKYSQCSPKSHNNYDLWTCYNSVWKKDSRNPRPGSELKWTFFNPKGAGHTYGLGQMGPERALMLTDLVHQVSGLELLTLENVEGLYDAVINPDSSIHYVAASNRVAIDIYSEYANFDISQNPGIVATLYNIGKERQHADELYKKTLKSLTENGSADYPSENYYGWFVNSRVEELRTSYEAGVTNCPQ